MTCYQYHWLTLSETSQALVYRNHHSPFYVLILSPPSRQICPKVAMSHYAKHFIVHPQLITIYQCDYSHVIDVGTMGTTGANDPHGYISQCQIYIKFWLCPYYDNKNSTLLFTWWWSGCEMELPILPVHQTTHIPYGIFGGIFSR